MKTNIIIISTILLSVSMLSGCGNENGQHNETKKEKTVFQTSRE